LRYHRRQAMTDMLPDARDGPYEVGLEDVRDEGVVGVLALPRGLARAPAVVVLPGSGGGIPTPFAAALASAGFKCLALAYFGLAPHPPELVEVPVETLARGIAWLRGRAGSGLDRVGVVGQSKGAEYALLAASLVPEDPALVLYVPSSVCWPGITRWEPDGGFRSSWTWQGKPLSFLPYHITPEFEEEQASGRPVRLSLLYGASLDHAEGADAAIVAERVRGPLLLVSGGDDQMWPSTRLADEVMGRLQNGGHAFERVHLSYPEAGHFSGPPSFNSQVSGPVGRFDLGGSAEANAAARTDSWPKVVDFLRRSLA
jgi:dienelactone hydrolase